MVYECTQLELPRPRDIRIVRSRRRTISLVITKEPALVIRAPHKISISYIEDLIRKKSKWIDRKYAEMERRPKIGERKFVDGEEFLYLGRPYVLKISDDISGDAELKDCLCISRKNLSRARDVIARWYRKRAREIIGERCRLYSCVAGAFPKSIRVTSAKRRWGSCTPRGSVNFSWRLVMAPIESLDYVVVHELVHLKHLNHGKSFWRKIGEILPDYTRHERWLKENEGLLAI